MYIDIAKTTYKGNTREYVRIAHSYRQDGKIKKEIIANLGRLDHIQANLPALGKALAGLGGEDLLLRQDLAGLPAPDVKEWGPSLVGRHLYEECGLGEILRGNVKKRRGGPRHEPLFQAMVINRLSRPSSKLAIRDWAAGVTLGEGIDHLIGSFRNPVTLANRFYDAMDFFQKAKEDIESELYYSLRNLFGLKVEVVFYDLTSSYFEGWDADLGRFGYSRDEKRSNLQVVIGLVLADGLPIAHHVYEGNRKDSTTLQPMLEDVQERFDIGGVTVVADRGLMTKKNVRFLEENGYPYILACRRRRDANVKAMLRRMPEQARRLDRPASEQYVIWEGKTDDGDRLVAVNNAETSRRDRDRRAEILRTFRRELYQLKASARAGNYKYRDDVVRAAAVLLARRSGLGRRYFTCEVSKDGLDLTFRAKSGVLALEKRIDGTTVLRTNDWDLSAAAVVAQYKELAQIEDSFRELKDFIRLRPMYHRVDRRVRSHVFICVLAHLLEKILQRRLDCAEVGCTARKALSELKKLHLVTDRILEVELKRPSGHGPLVQRVLKAVGLPSAKKIAEQMVLHQGENLQQNVTA